MKKGRKKNLEIIEKKKSERRILSTLSTFQIKLQFFVLLIYLELTFGNWLNPTSNSAPDGA
jgi:hypothetical protein